MKLSHSRIQTFRTCPKKFYWVYIENLVQKTTPRPLELGDLLHTGLALHHLKRDEEAKKAIEHDPEALKLYNAYLNNYPIEPFDVIATEHFTETEILDGVSFIIKGDKLIRFRSLLMMMEHKSLSKEDNRTLNSHIHGPQIKGYVWGLQQVLKEKIHGCLWDFIIKTKTPGFRRIPQLYNQKDLDLWLQATRDWAEQIQQCYDLTYWRRDLASCCTFMGECEFRPICIVGPDTPELRNSLYVPRPELIPTKRLERR